MRKKIKKHSGAATPLDGIVKRHPDGFGFFIPDDTTHPDVYLPKHTMLGVMTHDRVRIQAEKERSNHERSSTDRYRGEILEILSRGTKRIVGTLSKLNDKFFLIKDEGKGWGQDLKIPAQNVAEHANAKIGDLVACEILEYPTEGSNFIGKIVEVLGDLNDPYIDVRRVILTSGIPHEFSRKTLEEVKPLGENPTEKDFKNRKDLRHINIITIDGTTAKDFDDAVYTETAKDGYHLYVAIADVSHYVKPGTALDDDAYERGTSVYFPNFVVPMLPEKISNGLCSLNPHVPRLALVAEMTFDYSGVMTSSQFYEAVIESKARVTYGEAQEIIDGEVIDRLMPVKENILRCADLAKVLMAKRYREGSLDLEIPDTELQIDASGVPTDIIKAERLFSHKLIEELMLIANVAVAKFFDAKEIPALYRIHEPPKEDALATLTKYMNNFGSKINLHGEYLQKKLTKALREFEGKPEAHVLNVLTLRAMSQAKYHMDNKGHFGLGFSHYTHFTSPIRRYPDLIVHRLIKSLVIPQAGYKGLSEDDLLTAGTMLSACEQRSAKAERQVHAIKKARFMQKFIGEEFDGIVNSVTKFGIFVLLREYDIDGLIRLDDLGQDKWEFDEENLRLVAKRSGFSYQIGDKVQITVSSCDAELGQINFVLTEAAQTAMAAQTSSKSSYKERSKDERFNKKFKDNKFKKDKFHKRKEEEKSFKGSQSKDKNNKKNRDTKFKKEDTNSRVDRYALKTQEKSKSKFQSKSVAKFEPNTQVNEKRKADKLGLMMSFPKQSSVNNSQNPAPVSHKQQQTGASKKSLLDFLLEKGVIKDVSNKSQSTDREDFKKRSSSKDDSERVRKARPKKSSRKNRSR